MFQPEAAAMSDSIAALRGRITSIKDLFEQLQQAQTANHDTSKIMQQLAAELSVFTTTKKE
jgi:hypothetical protein